MAFMKEAHLLRLEEEFWRSIRDKDTDLAMNLTDDTCLLTSASGVSIVDKATFAKLMARDDWTLHDFELEDVQSQRLADGVAVIGYKVREHMTVDGRPVTLEAADSSVWVEKNGGWVCSVHTESILGDPYGRDRATA